MKTNSLIGYKKSGLKEKLYTTIDFRAIMSEAVNGIKNLPYKNLIFYSLLVLLGTLIMMRGQAEGFSKKANPKTPLVCKISPNKNLKAGSMTKIFLKNLDATTIEASDISVKFDTIEAGSITNLKPVKTNFSFEAQVPDLGLSYGESKKAGVVVSIDGTQIQSSKKFATVTIKGTETYLLKLESIAAVSNNPPNKTVFTVSDSTHISKILTYHWNSGNGDTPGTIGLKNTDETEAVIGTWNVVGTKGVDSTPGARWPKKANGPPYLYWTVQPNADIPAGTYEVVDSNPSTWSYTSDTGNMGITFVYGWKVAGSDGVSPVVSGHTTPETKKITSSPGEETTLALTDGTTVSAPSLSETFTMTAKRQTNKIKLSDDSLKSTGSMRVVTYDNLHLDTEYFPVTITFPSSEYGSINKDTLAVARIADVIIDGELKKDYLTLLSADVDSSGTITATDIFLPVTNGVTFSSSVKAGVSGLNYQTAGAIETTVKYVLVTIQANINWNQPALLLRMIPDSSLPAKRKPIDKLSATDKEKEEKKCIRNVIVLVHGHNEAEKTGGQLFFDSDADAPWFFSYKRDVWTPLYDAFITKHDKNVQSGCTVFYEYIYPSWRSAFDYSGPDLANKLKSELKGLLSSKDADPNILIVAHSMGGLVARSAIQQGDTDFHKAFQSLVTWGAPHRGSAIVSLSYVLTSPVPYLLQGFDPATQMGYAKSAVETYLQIDTPGTRDLRWDNSRPLALDKLFSPPVKTGEIGVYRLDKGTRLYSEKTRLFNDNDVYGTPALNGANNKWGGLKYNFAYGITTKYAPVDGVTGIAAGATMTRSLIATPEQQYLGVNINENDGAVPITSMAAEGLVGYRWNLGDTDHEEYYGTEKGPAVAESTFGWLSIFADDKKDFFKCDPFITSLSPSEGAVGSQVTIKGRCFNDSADNKLTVSFGGTTADTIQVTSCNEINATVPEGAATGNVVVTSGGVASNDVPFTVTKVVTCAFGNTYGTYTGYSLPNIEFNSCQEDGTISKYSTTTTGILMYLVLNGDGSVKNSKGDITGSWTCNSLNLNLNMTYKDGIEEYCWSKVPAEFKYQGSATVTVSDGVYTYAGSGNVLSQVITYTYANCPTIGNVTATCTTSTPFVVK